MRLNYPDIAKLFVGNAENADITLRGNHLFNPLDVYLGIFHTGTVAEINRKLKHGETIVQQIVAKHSSIPTILLGFGR